MKNEDYILSIGAGKNQIELIENIRKMNYKVISVDLNPVAPGRDLSDIFLNISSHNYKEIIEELKKLKINLVAVLTRSTGNPVLTTSKIAEKFGLRALNSDIAEILIDKNLFISKLNELNIPSPKKYTIDKKDEIKFPVFIKPSKTNISHAGMKKCSNLLELEISYEDAKKYSENNQVNIEEYILGYDLVSIDYIFENQIYHLTTIGEISSGEPNFDGIGWYSCPQKIDDMVANNSKHFLKQIGANHGFFQIATKTQIKDKISKIYEVHAEIGGDLVNDIFIPYLFDDYNIFRNVINLSLGITPIKVNSTIKPSIIFFKDKLKQYKIEHQDYLVKSYKYFPNYILLDFENFETMYKYLDKITNISITNQIGAGIELG